MGVDDVRDLLVRIGAASALPTLVHAGMVLLRVTLRQVLAEAVVLLVARRRCGGSHRRAALKVSLETALNILVAVILLVIWRRPDVSVMRSELAFRRCIFIIHLVMVLLFVGAERDRLVHQEIRDRNLLGTTGGNVVGSSKALVARLGSGGRPDYHRVLAGRLAGQRARVS